MQPRTAVLLVNLGTPDAPTADAIRRYLKEFLSDPRVIDTSRLLWWFVLRLFILPRRPAQLIEPYSSIWGDDSPIREVSNGLVTQLARQLPDLHVSCAMTYGSPAIGDAIGALPETVERLIVMPLFPQYASATTGAVFDKLAGALSGQRDLPALCLVKDYHARPQYIEAIATSIRQVWGDGGRTDKLIFSFHGLPESQASGDPYATQCQHSAKLVADNLGLADSEWLLTYQSRRGRMPWLQPYTEESLQQLVADGTGSVTVVCPGFAADCLETLHEIEIDARQSFLQAGGTTFRYVPALNATDAHTGVLLSIIRGHLN